MTQKTCTVFLSVVMPVCRIPTFFQSPYTVCRICLKSLLRRAKGFSWEPPWWGRDSGRRVSSAPLMCRSHVCGHVVQKQTVQSSWVSVMFLPLWVPRTGPTVRRSLLVWSLAEQRADMIQVLVFDVESTNM